MRPPHEEQLHVRLPALGVLMLAARPRHPVPRAVPGPDRPAHLVLARFVTREARPHDTTSLPPPKLTP